MTLRSTQRAVASVIVISLVPLGCGKPNRANIELRKQNATLQRELDQARRDRQADRQSLEALQRQQGSGVETLPPARLDRLFTVRDIKLGRLTGGADLDPDKPGDEGFKVHVGLVDQHGDDLKSSGAFVVEAFDLAGENGPAQVGRWEFPVEKSQDSWHSFLTRYEYVLTCPWQQAPPRHLEVTVKVTFTDELTGRQFTRQTVAKVKLPPVVTPPPQPSTQPAASR